MGRIVHLNFKYLERPCKEYMKLARNCGFSSNSIEVIRRAYCLYFFYERYFKCEKQKQKHLSDIQPNISISKNKYIQVTFNQILLKKKHLSNIY